MNLRQLGVVLLLGVAIGPLQSCTNQSQANQPGNTKVSFSCGTATLNGKEVPATIVESSGHAKPLTVIRWKPDNTYFGGQWTPQKRCEEVSKRFQEISDRDGLKYLTADEASWAKDYNVVCAVKDSDPNTHCEKDDLLFTLEKKDDPNEVLKNLIAFREEPNKNKALTRGKNPPKNFAEGKRVFFDVSKQLEEKSTDPAKNEKAF